MDIKTISATLALLGSGLVLEACDDGKKPATEVDAAKDKSKDGKDGAKDKPATDAAAAKGDSAKDASAKGEMACGEGKCAPGACGAHKDADEGAVHAKSEDSKEEAPADDGEQPDDADEDKT
jgi:hypothetical protein